MGHQQPPYSYRDFTSGHNFVDDTGITHELFGLQAGMEMLAMPSRDFFSKPGHEAGSGSSSIMMMSSDGTDCWQQSMIIDDLFPNSQVSNEEQRRGLSLSLPNQFGLLKSSSYSNNNNNNNNYQQFPRNYQVRESVFLKPTQELLNEFCKFGGDGSSPVRRQKSRKEDEDGEDYSASLMSMGGLELQRRKAKLISMLEEVDRRYKMYCEQMRGVVSSFEAVAGEGSAAVYSALALKAMSRHFRCLRDGIVGQIRATKKAMGDKDQVAPAGTTKGETPRLKMLDQCIRQRKAFQMGGVESQPWRPQRGLPERSVSILRAWLFEHFLHPYPSDMDKHILARQTGLSRSQVSNWFINARVRLWKPMVEEMYTEETKEHDINCDSDHNNQPDCENPNPNSVTIAAAATTTNSPQDQKPEIHVELDSLSSIIGKRRTDNFGVVDLDFASYNSSSSSSNQGGFGQGVSLTLGLQQHSGGGMSLSFSPASQQSLFFAREQMEEEQNLPCRNLMAAQLLHNLAG